MVPPEFAVGGPPPLRLASSKVVFAHRAALVHANVAFRVGESAVRPSRVLVGVAYLTSLGDLLRDERLAVLRARQRSSASGIVVTRNGPTRQAGIRHSRDGAAGARGRGRRTSLSSPSAATRRRSCIVPRVRGWHRGSRRGAGAGCLEVRARRQRIADAAVEVTLGPAGYGGSSSPNRFVIRPSRWPSRSMTAIWEAG